MNKPNNYENTKAYAGGAPLPAGPYICKVIDIAEMQSKKGKPMVKVALDIAEGPEAGRFLEQYRNDDRMEKKWPCVMYQLTEDQEGNCSRGFKTLLDCLEDDNPGYTTVWGEGFCAAIKGKMLGVVFRREQYEYNGELKWSCKPKSVRHIADIKEGKVKVPEDKLLKDRGGIALADPRADSFEEIDADVPF